MSLAFPEVLPARLDEDGRIAVDFGCAACGYNLRALPVGAACPECGTTIDAGANHDPLSAADAGYVREVSAGARWLSWGVAAMLPLVYPGLVVLTAGVWRLTRKEPGRKESWSVRNGRLLARWLVVLGVPASIGAAALMVRQFWSQGLSGQQWTTLDALMIGTHAAVFMGAMFAWRHLFDLAARADGADTARTLRRLWRRYFHVLLFVALIGIGNLAYDLADADRWLAGQWWLGPAVLALVAAVGVALWWQTLQATRRLAQVIAHALPES